MCGCGGPRERFTHDVILTMLEEEDGNANFKRQLFSWSKQQHCTCITPF